MIVWNNGKTGGEDPTKESRKDQSIKETQGRVVLANREYFKNKVVNCAIETSSKIKVDKSASLLKIVSVEWRLKHHYHTNKLVIANILYQPQKALNSQYLRVLMFKQLFQALFQFLLKQTRFLGLNQRDSCFQMEHQRNREN